jgi:hypothetical protein
MANGRGWNRNQKIEALMNEDETFIRTNLSSLLSAQEVKVKTGEIPGEWELLQINPTQSRPRNIEFSAILRNGSDCLHIRAKINRNTARLSNIEVEEI